MNFIEALKTGKTIKRPINDFFIKPDEPYLIISKLDMLSDDWVVVEETKEKQIKTSTQDWFDSKETYDKTSEGDKLSDKKKDYEGGYE